MNKNLIFVSLFISFFLSNIGTKKCFGSECPNIEIKEETKKVEEKKLGEQYVMENKNIDFSQDNLQITLKFDGITQYQSDYPKVDYRVTYIANFYDKESLGINNIQAIVTGVEPLYREYLVKFGNETRDRIEWDIEIEKNDDKTQVVQVVAEASYLGTTETYFYNSLYFKHKNEKTTEFWVIFCGFIGMILLTFCGMFVYFLITGKKENSDTIDINEDMNSGIVRDSTTKSTE